MRRAFGFFSLLFVTGQLSGFAPAPAPGKAIKPGQVAVGKPDANGLITMLRPMVTRLAKDDPFRVALHWETKSGPITPQNVTWSNYYDDTLTSITFTLTPPGGKPADFKLNPILVPGAKPPAIPFGYGPGYLMTLTKDGVEASGRKPTWKDKTHPDLTKEGVYTLQLKGEIVRPKDGNIAFTAGPIKLEVSSKVRSQVATVKIAAEAMKKHHPSVSVAKENFVLDDDKGNVLVHFRTPGRLWSVNHYIATVTPKGDAAKPTVREIGTCVAEGTLVAMAKGSKPIEKIAVGDRVLAYDTERGRKVLTTVRFIRVGQASETLVFNKTLRVTAEHPLWLGQWKRAGDVKAGDRLLDEKGQRVKAGAAVVKKGKVRVYDLTVGAPHCFFAGGFLVHNKKRMYSPKLDDPWYQYDLRPDPPKKK